jgi:hypothetical protein
LEKGGAHTHTPEKRVRRAHANGGDRGAAPAMWIAEGVCVCTCMSMCGPTEVPGRDKHTRAERRTAMAVMALAMWVCKDSPPPGSQHWASTSAHTQRTRTQHTPKGPWEMDTASAKRSLCPPCRATETWQASGCTPALQWLHGNQSQPGQRHTLDGMGSTQNVTRTAPRVPRPPCHTVTHALTSQPPASKQQQSCQQLKAGGWTVHQHPTQARKDPSRRVFNDNLRGKGAGWRGVRARWRSLNMTRRTPPSA